MAKPKRPRDPNVLAKLIVDIATGQVEEKPAPKEAPKGRAGGLRGGRARADALSSQQRVQIAKKAAQSRWRRKVRVD